MSATQSVTHRLTLLRHAQAAHARQGQHDFERPLDTTGQAQLRERAPAFATASAAFAVDRCVHSSAIRTTTTALAFAHACGLAKDAIQAEPALYEIDLSALLAFCAARRKPCNTCCWWGTTPPYRNWLGNCQRKRRLGG